MEVNLNGFAELEGKMYCRTPLIVKIANFQQNV